MCLLFFFFSLLTLSRFLSVFLFFLFTPRAHLDVPFPGRYMMASDGSDFCVRSDVWLAATAAAAAATGEGGDKEDVGWRQRAGVLLR